MPALTVETRSLGRRSAPLDRWSVPIPPGSADDGSGGLTLRQLITRIVTAEVGAFEQRQRAQRVVRVLSNREISDGAARGRIDPGGRAGNSEVNAEAAVAAALTGFEDGVYLVILDGEEQNDLDKQVYLAEDSRLVFLRLTFLAGA